MVSKRNGLTASTKRTRFRRLAFIFLLLGLVPVLAYRTPRSEPVLLRGEVQYENAPNRLDDLLRRAFEGLCGNEELVIADGALQPVYVNQKDLERRWPDRREDAASKGYTIRVSLRAAPLFFGGYGTADLVGIQRVENKKPVEGK